MNIMAIDENNKIEIVHVPNHLSDEYMKTFDLLKPPTKDELFDFLLEYDSLKVK
jgi:hypothetical protein